VKKVGSAAGNRRSAVSAAISARRVVYKTVDVIDGKPVPRYSTERPATGDFEILQ
jgi:hypothetical protein